MGGFARWTSYGESGGGGPLSPAVAWGTLEAPRRDAHVRRPPNRQRPHQPRPRRRAGRPRAAVRPLPRLPARAGPRPARPAPTRQVRLLRRGAGDAARGAPRLRRLPGYGRARTPGLAAAHPVAQP